MVKVLIFAGGTGRRMNARTRPKQFLMMHGRPIILYTLEKFERHPDIGEIVIVCLEGWIDRLWDYIHQYMLNDKKKNKQMNTDHCSLRCNLRYS